MTDPFLRWAGGKRQFLKRYSKYFVDINPKNKFIEPFVGAGTIFFAFNADNNIINDINTELMNCYNILTSDRMYRKLKYELRKKKYKNDSRTFKKLRERYNEIRKNKQNSNELEKVALFLYLNATCFNGLYRENACGEFNTSYGKRVSLKFPETLLKKLDKAKEYIDSRNVKLYNGHYENVLKKARQGDFVYLDPPYHPINANSFTKYSKGDFTPEDQKKLVKWCDKLDRKGCYVMYSNSNTKFIKNLFKKLPGKWRIKELSAKRYISCDAETRTPKKKIELLVTNF
jgi:DNA adenine methylase